MGHPTDNGDPAAGLPAAEVRQATGLPLRPGDLVDGRFRIRRLRKVDWGRPFYVVEQLSIGAPALLKVFSARSDGGHVSQCLTEARITSRACNPRVPAAYDMGRLPDGSAYLVFDYIDAPSLRMLLRGGPFPHSLVLELGIQLTAALSALHHAGVAHGRLTADDVVLHEPGSGVPFVRLMDAGACVPLEPTRAASVDDVRSIGSLVLRMWLGRTVPEREQEAALARVGVPRQLRTLVRGACGGRVGSVQLLREGLDAASTPVVPDAPPAADGEPVPLCRPRSGSGAGGPAPRAAGAAHRTAAVRDRLPLARWWVATVLLLAFLGAVGLAKVLGVPTQWFTRLLMSLSLAGSLAIGAA